VTEQQRQRGTALQRVLLGVALCALLLSCLPASLRAEDDAAWATRAALFSYDAGLPLQISEEPQQVAGGCTTQNVRFASANGEIVPAVVCKPVNVAKPPVVLFLHGLGGSKNDVRMMATLLAPLGIAAVSIDAQYHGDRKKPGEEILSADLKRSRQAIIQTIIDNRRAVDYILQRPDLDGSRIGLLGVSMGAILGSIVTAVEPRIGSACLVVGGGRWDLILTQSEHPVSKYLLEHGVTAERLATEMADIDPVNFIGHVAPRRVLMINGTRDTIVPKAATEALYEAAQMPKEIHWLEGGHVPPIPPLLALAVAWAKASVIGAQGK
jgi:uncharacterized protein